MKKVEHNVLIIGYGEIGKTISQIEEEAGSIVYIQDLDNEAPRGIEYNIAHVCIPYTESFKQIIINYSQKFKLNMMIIHSTIPVGTTESLEGNGFEVAHSPVIGVHPNLYDGVKTFKKFANKKRAEEYLDSIGINARYMKGTELAKILSTTYYGRNILFAKEVKRLCDYYRLDYRDVYQKWNKNYNSGYKELGMSNVVRPVLFPPEGEIGGHCIVPNRDLLPDCNLKELSKIMNEDNSTGLELKVKNNEVDNV